MFITLLVSFLGLLLSIYAFKIEIKLKKNKKYKAICDKNSKISCSKAFSSKYSHLLGVPNSLGGIFFYSLLIYLSLINFYDIIFLLSSFSFLISLILAYFSFFKLKIICLLCTLIYLVNLILIISSYFKI